MPENLLQFLKIDLSDDAAARVPVPGAAAVVKEQPLGGDAAPFHLPAAAGNRERAGNTNYAQAAGLEAGTVAGERGE